MKQPHNLQEVGRHFQIDGTFVSAEPYGSGHINDTYAAVYEQAGKRIRFIHQRINHAIFRDPPGLMENIARVTNHVRTRLAAAGTPDAGRRTLTLVPATDGNAFRRDEAGNFWRTYLFIENAHTVDFVQSEAQAFQAARAFGQFQAMLTDLPGPRLHETIPDFHHTPKRFAALEKAVAADARNRAKSARTEIEFAMARREAAGRLVEALARGEVPERITHNDTKINNVMLDDATGEGLCVIDLDTVMPGLALYDFGDMVRTTTCPAAEDERDLSRVVVSLPLFEALVRGYLETAGGFLNPVEKQLLVFAGRLITIEIGVRFLTDHLAGDTYFKVHREGHNLDRCRTQFKLVRDMEERAEKMEQMVAGQARSQPSTLDPRTPKLDFGSS